MRSCFSLVGLGVFLMISGLGRAQDHDFNWMFGYSTQDSVLRFGGAQMSFTESGQRSISYLDIPIDAGNSASVSDQEGNLIAYSNGCQVVGPTHSILPGGDTINAGRIYNIYCRDGARYPYSQGIVWVPIQENNDEVLVRLLHLWIGDNGIVQEVRYTDISRDKATGEVEILENDVIAAEQNFHLNLTTVKHANGRDWWILLPEYRSNTIFSYLSTPGGVSPIGTQEIGVPWSREDWSGQNCFSPDGSKFVRVNPFNGIHIYNFDRCSGLLSSPLVISFNDDTVASCGAAFSANSRFLYIATTLRIYQYDMHADDIVESRITVAEYDGFVAPFSTTFFQLMLGPDHKIYGTAPNGVYVLHVIHRPNVRGELCQVEQHGIELPTHHAFSTPNFPHYRLGPIDGSICDTLGIDNDPVARWRYETKGDPDDPSSVMFTDLSYFDPQDWLWDFGDGSTSAEIHPVHIFEEKGLYNVCLTVSNDNATDSACQWVEVEMTTSTDDVLSTLPGAEMQVFPNPFTERIRIKYGLDHQVGQYRVRLIDVHGRVIHDQDIMVPATVHLERLPKGMYACVLLGDQGKVLDSKVVVKQ